MIAGDRVMVEMPGHARHGRVATVEELFASEIGTLVALRFDDGRDLALPPSNVRLLRGDAA